MPEAVITFAGLMPYQGRSGVPDIHEFCPCLIVRVDGEQLFRVHVQLTWEVASTPPALSRARVILLKPPVMH